MDLFDEVQRQEEAAPYERLAGKALAAYGLETARLDLVSRGAHVLFRATDPASKAAYALRIHPRGSDRERILWTLLWLAAIRRDADPPVPEPILTRSGDLIQSLSTRGVSGFRQVTLVGWLAGETVPIADWTVNEARRLGRAIGGIHRSAVSSHLPPESEAAPRDADALDEELDPDRLAAAVAPGEGPLLSRALEAACDAVSDLGAEDVGPIHGDLTPDHVLFGGADVRLVGFARAHVGHRAYDLATVDLAFRSVDGEDTLRAGLLEGYRTARSLPDRLVERLGLFAALRLLDELAVRAAVRAEGAEQRPRSSRRIVERLRALVESTEH